MTNKDLFKEAIADAKQVREAALANAKVALEEALTPRLQSMLSMKLEEMENEEEVEEGFDTNEFGFDEEDAVNEAEDDLEEDFDLSEILAELEAEEKEGKEEMKEAEEEEAGEESEEEADEEKADEVEEEIEVADMSVEDLKDLIKGIISQEMGDDEMGMDDMEAGEDEMEMGDEAEEMEVGDEEDEINLEELLAELEAVDLEEVEEAKKSNEDLDEAINTINTLRTELQEVNLLNAKLLYVNKIFKAKNLTESQKVKVIASFDKATTAKEAKIVFESLESTLTAISTSNNKSQIKESLGFASKAAGVAPKKQIVEVNDSISRMQQLAGIK